jgi:hypothetical protein
MSQGGLMFDSTIPELLAIDQKRLSVYLQFLEQDESLFKKLGISIGINLGLINLKTINPESLDEINTIRKLKLLHKKLDKSGALYDVRATSYEDIYGSNKHFFLEKNIKARKFFVPVEIKEAKDIDHLIVWVCEPDEITPYENFEEKGSYLFLIESFWEDDNYHAMISGCSAFQWVVKNAFDKSDDVWHKHDRSDDRDPIKCLVDLGAIDQGEKVISTLYRRRYMSNEQMYKLKGIQYRGFDVVGYPVAIYSEKMT